jgi:hypothetical protein
MKINYHPVVKSKLSENAIDKIEHKPKHLGAALKL